MSLIGKQDQAEHRTRSVENSHREPLRIFSDLHLGHQLSRIERVSALRPLVSGAGTVVFNGDTWQELAVPYRARSSEMLIELKEMCAEEGAKTVFLSGNHDPGCPGDGWLELAGGRMVVTHGDALLFGGSPWKREILTNERLVREIWARHPAAAVDLRVRIQVAREIARELCSVEFPSGRHLVQRAYDAAFPPQRALWMLASWFGQGELGHEFCERYVPQAEVLILGHFHHHGCWLKNGRLVINTGTFLVPGRAHWVEWNDGWLSRGVIEETPSACRMGERLGSWRL